MLLMLLSLSAFAGEPEVVSNLTIVVEDSRYEEIYVEPTKMVCDVECPAKSWIENAVFMEAARKHKSWLKKGEVGAVYNKDTIELTHNDCDWNRNPLPCGKENGVWVLRSTFVQSSEKASIQLMLFDENGVIIGQGSQDTVKKTTVIERRRVTQQNLPGQNGVVQTCPQGQNTCATIPFNSRGQPIYQIEDLEPSIVVQAPVILEKHVSQAMIGVYDSVRK